MSTLHLSRAQVALGRAPANERGATAEYLLHQAIADLFGDRDDRGYVWRQLSRTSAGAEVLLLSTVVPNPDAGAGMPPHRRVTSAVSKPFRPELHAGQQLDFEVRVSATRVVTMPGQAADIMDVGEAKPRKQRQDVWDVVFAAGPDDSVRMNDVYATWLRAQLAHVAEVGSTSVTERGMVRVRRSVRTPAIPVVATNLVGDLTVLDPAGLVARMASGIGRARAFGCGLLCLARLGSRPRRPRVLADVAGGARPGAKPLPNV